MFKAASWNVNSLKVRLPHLLDWLQANQPDLLGLQETKLTDENFPREEIENAGYQVIFSGQKTYNGVAILNKTTSDPTDIVTDLPGLKDPQRRVLAATYGDIRFINLYVPNGSEVGSEKYAYKLDWLEKLITYIKEQCAQHTKVIVVGDFNIAPEDRDVHDPAVWKDAVLCSRPEREAFQHLLGCGLHDSFRLFAQGDGLFSWWDYRAAGFRRNLGLRIDHILVSNALKNVCTSSIIDTEPRKLERPSDHAPVLAEFKL